MFCEARNTFDPLIISPILNKAVKGGAKTTSPFLMVVVPSLIALAKAIDSAMVLCIFQLPATIHFLIFYFLIMRLAENESRRVGMKFEALVELYPKTCFGVHTRDFSSAAIPGRVFLPAIPETRRRRWRYK